MDLKEIKAVIDLMTKNGLSEFELEKAEVKIRIKKSGNEAPSLSINPGIPRQNATFSSEIPMPPSLVALPAAAPQAPAPAAAVDSSIPIVSPMVGTFYFAPSPDSAPYVEVGTEVTVDTVVCIIEAMKVMNEIKAEVKGVITEVLAQNGKPVEFGKPLFKVRPT